MVLQKPYCKRIAPAVQAAPFEKGSLYISSVLDKTLKPTLISERHLN
jgi:hypothetical protein